jgi:hypothetical protein
MRVLLSVARSFLASRSAALFSSSSLIALVICDPANAAAATIVAAGRAYRHSRTQVARVELLRVVEMPNLHQTDSAVSKIQTPNEISSMRGLKRFRVWFEIYLC